MTKQQKKFILTADNYYSKEADSEYLSSSQISAFLKCESHAYAKFVTGEWVDDPAPALFEGNYVHSYFESKEAHEKFKEQHVGKELPTRYGTKKILTPARIRVLDGMTARVSKDEWFMRAVKKGKQEVIFTVKLWGFWFKCKIDNVNYDSKIITDIKTTRSLIEKQKANFDATTGEFSYRPTNNTHFVYTDFYNVWNYWLQFALYRAIVEESTGDEYALLMAAISKTEPVQYDLMEMSGDRHSGEIDVNEDTLAFELNRVKETAERIERIKGGAKPLRCNNCQYCHETKSIKKHCKIKTARPVGSK